MEDTQIQDVVYCLAVSPDFARDGICLAARASGLYRSEDGGLTWQGAYASLELEAPLTTTAVAVSPNFEADRSVFAGVPGGVLRSVDGGQNWYVASFPSPPPFVSALAVSPNFAQDGTLLVGTLEDGVLRSGDRGEHWAAWNFGLLDLNVLCLALSPDFGDAAKATLAYPAATPGRLAGQAAGRLAATPGRLDETIFAGTESGIFRSTNGGRAWREVDFPTQFAPVLSLALSPGFATDGFLLAGTESNGLFCSRDQGSTWERLGEEAVTGAVNSILLAPDFPAKPDVLVLLEDALLVSHDGGQSWSDWEADLPVEHGISAVAAPHGLDAGARLLVGMVEGGVLRV